MSSYAEKTQSDCEHTPAPGPVAEKDPRPRPPGHLLGLLLTVAASTACVAYATGCSYGTVSQLWFVPMAFRQSSPPLLSRDVFMTMLARSSPTFFWRLVGLVCGNGNPQVGLTVAGVVCFCLTLLALAHLARTVSAEPAAPFLAVLLAAVPDATLNLCNTRADHASAAWPLILLGASYFLRGQRVLGCALVALMANFHLLNAGVMLAALVGAQVLMGPREQRRSLAVSVALALVCMGPVLYQLLTGATHAPALSSQDQQLWYSLMRSLHGTHLFVSEWHSLFIWAPLLSALLVALITQYGKPEDQVARLLAGMVTVLCAIFLVGVLASETQMSVTLTRLQLVRIRYLIAVPAALMILRNCLSAWPKSSRFQKIASGGLLLGLASGSTALLAPLLAAVSRAAAAPSASSHNRWFAGCALLLLLGAGMALRVGLPGLSLGASALLVGWMGCALLGRRTWRAMAQPWPLVALVAVALLASVVTGRENRCPPPDRDWVATQLWCKDHTPVDALFITPIANAGFRVFSQRATVMEETDSQAAFFDPLAARVWLQRLRDFGCTGYTADAQAYDRLSWADFARLGKRFGAKYGMTDRPLPASPAPLFVSGRFRVYPL